MARVLIVDDEPTDLAIIKSLVEQLGHEVHLASDGEEAFKKYLRKDIEVVITDLEMPRVDGVEFIEALQALYPDTKIIAVSGEGPDRLHAAKRGGCHRAAQQANPLRSAGQGPRKGRPRPSIGLPLLLDFYGMPYVEGASLNG